jgi:PAS domain S-box-containing protein
MQNIQNSLLRIDSDVSSIKKELQHNGGSSLKDYVSRLDAELIKQEKRQKALIQDLTYGTFETDATGKIVHVNRTYCRLSGRTPDELMGSGWINCVSSQYRDDVTKNWHLTVTENRDWTDTFSFVIPTGGEISVIFTATPMFNTKNALIGYFGTIQPHNEE